MPDDLSIQGSLAETTVPDLLRSLIKSGETAMLSIQRDRHTDAIYVREGKLVAASSSDPDMGLAETLLRTGELSLDQYNRALDQLVISRRVGTLLCELGYLQPEELTRAVERQAITIIQGLLPCRDGDYLLEFTDNFPEGIIPLSLATERLLLDGVARIDYWSLILRGIGRMERIIESVPDADARSYHLELTDQESHIMALLTEPQTVEILCSRSYLPNFATCRTVWGLLTVNLLQDAAELPEILNEKRAAEATEYEIEGLVERYNTVFQQIFGVIFQRVGDHTYDFVDRVVLRLSPQITPYLSGMSLVNEARLDVDQLLNNVVASGSANYSTVVHSILNELLYAWIYEVKGEFGAEVEAQVVRIAETLKP